VRGDLGDVVYLQSVPTGELRGLPGEGVFSRSAAVCAECANRCHHYRAHFCDKCCPGRVKWEYDQLTGTTYPMRTFYCPDANRPDHPEKYCADCHPSIGTG
jgi:hypothetical protein